MNGLIDVEWTDGDEIVADGGVPVVVVVVGGNGVEVDPD